MFGLEQCCSGHAAVAFAGRADNLVRQQPTPLTLCALPHTRLVQDINHRLQDGSAQLLIGKSTSKSTYKSLVMCHPCLSTAGHGKMTHNAFQTWLG